MRNLLIIKLGYTETLDSSLSQTTSLGDVLRTTFILHFFKDCQISWLVDKKAVPLLESNEYINKLLIYNANSIDQLKKETFDTIVNFEKLPEICLLADSLKAREHLGFKFNNLNGNIQNYSASSKRLVELSQDIDKRRKNKDCWQKILAQALGQVWKGENYILGCKPKSKVKYDIGFNWTTSTKWTNKAWPKPYWEKLQGLVKNRYSISWQQGLDSLYEYIEWIDSCRLMVTADTLGLHLSLALKKRVIALFGPTSPYEINFYNCGSFLAPKIPYKCLPCFKLFCDKKKQCMEYISPQTVKEKIDNEFKYYISSRKV